jgi:hypothetical protein
MNGEISLIRKISQNFTAENFESRNSYSHAGKYKGYIIKCSWKYLSVLMWTENFAKQSFENISRKYELCRNFSIHPPPLKYISLWGTEPQLSIGKHWPTPRTTHWLCCYFPYEPFGSKFLKKAKARGHIK